MKSIYSNHSQHWYKLDGTPCYSVPSKSGALRPATLADARKLNLLPSVTTIGRLYPADALQNWKRESDILAAITTPRLPGDTDESFIRSVLQSADEESSRAAAVGTRRHDICEQVHSAGLLDPISDEDLRFCQPYFDWFNANVKQVIESEFIVVHKELGYAGNVDLLCELNDGRTAVVDLKNRRKPANYAQDFLQLSAYSECFRAVGAVPHGISIVLGTAEPSIAVKELDFVEHGYHFESFKLCLELFFRSKDYRPTL